MIKEVKIVKETTERHKYCDVCSQEIKHTLACCTATCSYCRKDLCDKCIGHEEDDGTDYRTVWCKSCWDLGNDYRPKIEELENEIHKLYEEWRSKCKQ